MSQFPRFAKQNSLLRGGNPKDPAGEVTSCLCRRRTPVVWSRDQSVLFFQLLHKFANLVTFCALKEKMQAEGKWTIFVSWDFLWKVHISAVTMFERYNITCFMFLVASGWRWPPQTLGATKPRSLLNLGENGAEFWMTPWCFEHEIDKFEPGSTYYKSQKTIIDVEQMQNI